jgi:3-deoxy-manno-octulosonate cytidylyltransferase (CMP-KDO synthetase)
VEQHGENPRKPVIAVIPARYGSTRLAGKMLLPIGGKPLVVCTAFRVAEASLIDSVIVATDDERIASVAESFGLSVALTSKNHRSGSDRVAEVARGLEAESVIVNVQGDEPLVDPEAIDYAISALLNDPAADMATIYERFYDADEILDPAAVKVVEADGYAIYFSRQPIPFPRDAAAESGNDLRLALRKYPRLMALYRKHVGVYVYRREYLLRFSELAPTVLETTEMLEQLRALEDGAKIRLIESKGRSIGIDTEEDLSRVINIYKTADIESGGF